MGERTPDFSGWATKNNLVCTDGRTILNDAFKHQDQMQVPLVWQHDHNDPSNILGHAVLENRAFGVYTHGYFNKTPRALDAKESVAHGDITSLSIYANKLKQLGKSVAHGNIVEVSLVMAGANPGATIENVYISHADGADDVLEAIIYTGLTLEHQDKPEEGDKMADEKDGEKTVAEIIDSMTEEQKNAMYFVVGEAVSSKKGDDDDDDDDSAKHDDMSAEEFLAHVNNTIQEGIDTMARNTFAQYGDNHEGSDEDRLTHAQFVEIVSAARSNKVDSLRDVLIHSGAEYGIENIDYLFPDAKALNNEPDFISRRMEWVDKVLRGTKHSPFAKVKTIHADITEPEARAKGYIKGKMKKEEVFKLLKRSTSPTTVYKKQKLDRDDMLDITDMNIVSYLQNEMRVMLEEEIARSILIGDGRPELDDDKVKDPAGSPQGDGIRSILHDHELYAHPVQLAANTAPKDLVKGIIRSRRHYKGTGRPTLFIGDIELTDIMLEEDKFGRPLYATEEALAATLRVAEIVPVEIFNEVEGLVAILVNLVDYTVGANKGGEITNFDQFDIDFNQHKYLAETRISGGLTKPKSAVVIQRSEGTAVTATPPSFASAANRITITATTGVTYLIDDEPATGQIVIEEDTEVIAIANEDYFLTPGSTRSWSFTFTASGS